MMVKNWVLLLTIGIYLNVSAQTGDSSARSNPRKFILEGRISDTVVIPPTCGYIAFATAIEMEIISYSDTSYKRDHLVVIYCCPDFKDTAYFKVGTVYKWVVQDQNPAQFGWAIPNEDKLRENGLSYYLYVMDE